MPTSPRSTKFWIVQARALLGTLSFLLFTFNLQLIPITLIIIIFQTNPLWASLLGYAFNNETISRFESSAMIVSFATVIFIALSRSQQTSSDELSLSVETSSQGAAKYATEITTAGLWLGVFFCLCHSWMFAIVGVMSRRLQNIHFTGIMHVQAVQGLFVMLGILGF